jgi:ABC-type Zn uptake system ZnuABC Zn-binding protein ZnuA
MPPWNSFAPAWRRLSAVLGLILLNAGSTEASPPRIRVLASFFPAACVTLNVAGDLADVEVLLGANAEPHDFQLSRSDLQKIVQADLIVLNGLGMEAWLERALRQAGVVRPVVELATGLEAQLIRRESSAHRDLSWRGHREAAHGTEPHDGSDINPHIWLDPRLLGHGTTNVGRALERADPANAPVYRARSARFVDRLHQLDLELLAQLEPLRGVPVVTYHDAFAYFARRYGLQVVGVIEPVAEVDPAPRYLVALSRRARSERVRALFDEPGARSMLVTRLAADWGVPVASLDTLESGPVDPGAYERAMRDNARLLRNTLP